MSVRSTEVSRSSGGTTVIHIFLLCLPCFPVNLHSVSALVVGVIMYFLDSMI